jgi:curved DNA-binding protein CbpA
MPDPYLTLGVPREADDAAVHAAYLAAVRSCPPDRDPQRFDAVRKAYEAIRTRRDRLAYDLFDHTPPEPLDILDLAAPVQGPGRPDLALFQALLRGGD